MIRCSLSRSPILALLVLVLALSPARADEDAYAEFATLSEGLLRELRSPLTSVVPSRLSETAARLAALPRGDLTEDEWIDLHVLLGEVERRVTPQPARATPPPISREPLRAIPTASDLAREDAVDLMDEASRLHRALSAEGPPAGGADLRDAELRSRDLARSLRAAARGEDPLTAAAREVLAEEAESLAFDLRCRIEGLGPAGRDRFEWLLAKRQGVSLAPERARTIGRREWDLALHGLERLAEATSPGESWEKLLERAKADHPADTDELLAHCRAATREAVERARDSGLVSVPAYAEDIEVRLQPPSQWIPYAQYLRGRVDGRGRFHGTAAYTRPPKALHGRSLTRWLRDRNRHWMRVICAHEGVPGHHLQFAAASRVKSRFRGFGYNSLYVEGWALYSEELMEREGWFEDPLDKVSWLRMRLWRAARVLIDVGLHTEGMRPSAAVRMLTDTVGLAPDAAVAEVRRYLSMPTQPLSYMVGYRRITAMRRAWIAAHGPDTEREFHDRFLSLGCIPLDLAAAVLLDRRAAYDRAHPREF